MRFKKMDSFLIRNFYLLIGTFVVLCLCSSISATEIQSDSVMFDWYNGRNLKIEGKGWINTPSFYARLPEKAKKMVTDDVWHLSMMTAGLYYCFQTNADSLLVKWTLLLDELGYPNMAPTAVSGIDLYAKKSQDKWIFVGNGRGEQISNEKTFNLPESNEYMLYLPIYNGVKSLEIGIPKGHQFSQSDNKKQKPIVFYGTSITQGGCSSRPGMAATSITGRNLDLPVINLGFSGSGKMEPELANLISELDASLYVLDCLHNMNAKMIIERYEPFVLKLRKAKPETPIILVEDSHYLDKSPTEDGKLVRNIYHNLLSAGIKNVYFLSNKGMLGSDGEGTVDTVHPNDLGMLRQAAVFTDFIARLLLRK